MLAIGGQIPDVLVPATPGLCDAATPLTDLVAAGPLIVSSYPADDTPLCTRQMCAVRDAVGANAQRLADAGVRVAGISPQGPESHERFARRRGLGFPLIADEDKRVLRALDMLGPLAIPRRVSYLLLPGGVVGDAVSAELRMGRHAAFIERALAAVARSADRPGQNQREQDHSKPDQSRADRRGPGSKAGA